VPQLKCLSIRQPWIDLILCGRKRVENRTWTTRHRGPLALHSSTSLETWDGLTDAERDELAPGWRTAGPPRLGFVLGVVELVTICRHQDLPAELRQHRFTLDHPENWCWVLERPRLLKEPVRAKGNSTLFRVVVSDALLGAQNTATTPLA
jgi:hypothetical protein